MYQFPFGSQLVVVPGPGGTSNSSQAQQLRLAA
jgi:hypothetical protein